MIYFCCDPLRRNQVAGSAFNGIDYLEVLDHEIELTDPANRQKKLVVHFINDVAPSALGTGNIQIEGGERIRGIVVINAAADTIDARALNVDLDKYGDFSIYTLRLVQNAQNPAPPAGIDPLFTAVDFSFKVDCPADFDCQPRCDCPPAVREEPEIDYLAKDYASFRRLMLDRMTLLMPEWRERNPADLGVALVETLAYVGDHLSYQQDAIATEAYLGTARRRVSLRRHALLVDYPMHDGCNARTWVHIDVDTDTTLTLAGAQLLTRIPGLAPGIAAGADTQRAAIQQSPTIFEPLLVAEAVSLHAAHSAMPLYTWSGDRCCLPRGATSATLRGSYPNLEAGDAVLFEEVRGPRTGEPGDADPRHRHVVRLTRVSPTQPDPPAPPATSTDPLTGEAVTEIEWALADALPFPLCISGVTDDAHGAIHLDDISVVRGNLVLVDHGATVSDESLGAVPAPSLFAPTLR